MATSSVSDQMDHLSNLPDELLITILSFLPTRVAARTSALSRRFRHLWKASSSVDLTVFEDDVVFNKSNFETMATCTLLSRDPSSGPLVDLCLYLDMANHLPESFWSSLLVKVRSLGVRHLTFHTVSSLEAFMPTICSIDSLQSLELLGYLGKTFPFDVTFKRLQRLSLTLHEHTSAELNLLLLDLPFLHDLHVQLYLYMNTVFTLSSETVRKLGLEIIDAHPRAEFVGLYMPSLEMLSLETDYLDRLPRFDGDMPFLRKAVIVLDGLHNGEVRSVAWLLHCVSSAEELTLEIVETLEKKWPFPVILKPGKYVPNFPNLKHLDVKMCFHEHNFESVIALLRHSPALESLKVVYEDPVKWTTSRKGDELPSNAYGNHNCIHFRDLHLGQHGKEFMNLVRKETLMINKQEEESDLLKNLIFVI